MKGRNSTTVGVAGVHVGKGEDEVEGGKGEGKDGFVHFWFVVIVGVVCRVCCVELFCKLLVRVRLN